MMMDNEPKLQVITGARFGCVFSPEGMCGAHGTFIQDHDAITTSETMTLAEAKRRFPDTDPVIWDKLEA